MTSFAKTISPTLIAADSPRPDFGAAGQIEAAQTQGRESTMVTKDAPRPVLKPSPALSYGPDGTAFNTAWQGEAKAARREAFKAKRREETAQSRARSFARAVAR